MASQKARRARWTRSPSASTGPRSFERGNRTIRESRYSGFIRFNGAALIRARKYRRGSCIDRIHRQASTGPRSFERGNHPREGTAILAHVWLQRGRAHSSAEIRPGSADTTWDSRASTGPRSFERGNGVSAEQAKGHKMLQRGRAHSSAEMTERRKATPTYSSRFNGAALIRARK